MSSRLSILLRPIVLLAALAVATSGATASESRLTAQHGGYVEDAVVVGEFAYVAQGSSIVTLRLGDSTDPLEVASVSAPLGGEVRAVVVHRDRLYASWWGPVSEGTLSVFSLANPSRPAFLGRLDVPGFDPLQPRGMALVSDTLYVLAAPGLLPIDLSDPDQPVAGTPTAANGVRRLTPYDDDHVIAWGITPIGYFLGRIFDVSAPLSPAEVGSFPGGIFYDLDVGDGFVVASGAGFSIFDLRDPADPVFVSSRDGFDGIAGELVADHFLVADGDEVRSWDLSDPSNPVEVGAASAPVANTRWATHGSDQALIFTDRGTVVQLDVSNPSAPALASSVDLPVGSYPITLAPVGPSFYVADAYRGLRLLDAKMRNLSDVDLSVLSVNDIAVNGSRALVADFHFGLRYVDVSSPASPVPLGELELVEPLSVEFDGDRAWAAAGTINTRLLTLDLSTPSTPQIVASIELGGRSDLQRHGNLLYVADSGSPGGLRIFDVSGAVPVQLSRFVGCQPLDVDVLGSIAALACVGDEMQLLDVSNPAVPVPLGVYEPAQSPFLVTSVQFAADGQAVYLGFLGGVDAVDVSNPASPVQTQRLEVGGWIDELEADSEGRIWAVGGEAGLARIDEVGPVFGSLAKPALRSHEPKSTVGQR